MVASNILVLASLLVYQSTATSLRGSHVQRRVPALPALYCTVEEAACEDDPVCAQCLVEATIPVIPDIDPDTSSCEILVAWWDGIAFDDVITCNHIYGVPILSAYLYCLFDTYKYSAEIEVCETGPTMAPTVSPSDAPVGIETPMPTVGGESSSEEAGSGSSSQEGEASQEGSSSQEGETSQEGSSSQEGETSQEESSSQEGEASQEESSSQEGEASQEGGSSSQGGEASQEGGSSSQGGEGGGIPPGPPVY